MVVNFLWNQLKSTLLGAPVRVSLIGSFAVGRLLYHIWATPDGSLYRGPQVLLASSSILLPRHFSAAIIIYNIIFFGIPTQTEDQQLSRNLPGLQHLTGTAETSWTEQVLACCPFCQKIAMVRLAEPWSKATLINPMYMFIISVLLLQRILSTISNEIFLFNSKNSSRKPLQQKELLGIQYQDIKRNEHSLRPKTN